MFSFKQEYASIHSTWPELKARERLQLIELINESLSAFLAHIWQRIQEALEKSSQETKSKFYEFINSLAYKQADNEIDSTEWYELGPELRYILYSEGIVRYDRLRPVHFPAAILSQYLMQKAKGRAERAAVSPPPTTGHSLTISHPGEQTVLVSLSEVDYRLFKTLLQHPERCKEDELIQGAWGRLIEKPRFTQRMHQLRKKLKDQGVVTEIIENNSGGFSSRNPPE